MAGSSSLLDTPKARISSEGLTYGVELEFVFAFHQDELLVVFDDAVYGEECFLQKHIPYCVREEDVFTPIPLIDLPNHVYNSWGIVYTEPKSKEGMMAPYQMEPMRIVGNKFSEKYPDFRYRIKAAISEEDKTKDIYHTWIVTRDYSVCGVGSENIPAWLNRNNIDSGEWDSIGIEIVSRVLNSASPEGKQEIEKVIDAVKGGGNDSYGAFITNQCGLHVHVQAPQKLQELKELALLLIVYEQEIARLHPPCRGPHHDAVQWIAESNRMGVMQHPPDLATGHFDCSTNVLEQRYRGPIERLRAQLQDISNTSALVKFMNHPANYKFPRGNRNKQVNFLSINRGDNFASTIEFRQARGSLCAEDISRWVDFCVGLVKLSKLYSEDPGRFPLKGLGRYHEPDGKLRLNLINVYALMRDMELGNEAISYWQRRIAGYQMGMHGDADDRADNELPPPEPIV